MASSNNYVPLVWNGKHSFHCELKMNKQGGRIPVDSGEKKTKPRHESRKMVLKLELGSILDWKIVETY